MSEYSIIDIGSIEETTTRVSWAGQIRAAWQASSDSIIECGHLLIAARAALRHGERRAMIEKDLPFKAATTERLMAIARNPNIANPAHAQHLPPSWTTLYELTKLPDEVDPRNQSYQENTA
jgi:hypothetical protein